MDQVKGEAAGVPFVALPPPSGAGDAPVVVAWHLFDPPRTEAALAAALPLAGLDAWRIYLGLPLSGTRLPAGGWDEVLRRAAEDAVLEMDKPVVYGALEEFAAAFPDLQGRLGFDPTRVGLLGGSIGAAVAQLVAVEGGVDVKALVLVSPVVQLRRAVEAVGARFGATYPWADESNAVADRLDFVARAPEVARGHRPAVLAVVGEQDDLGFREPAAALVAALRQAYGDDGRVELVTVPDMAHALAEEPGSEPAPQTPHAQVVDRLAAEWLGRHLG